MSYRLIEFSEIEGRDKIVNVPKLITETIVRGLNKCRMQEREIDWKKLKEYVMEYFYCADYRADACIEEAKLIINKKEVLI